MAIHYDPATNRFRQDGRFVSRERGMRSSIARREYAAAEAGRQMLRLEKEYEQARAAEAEALRKQVALDMSRIRRGGVPGEPFIPPDAIPMPGYPGAYIIPDLPKEPLPPPIETRRGVEDFWDEWQSQFEEWGDDEDDEVDSP